MLKVTNFKKNIILSFMGIYSSTAIASAISNSFITEYRIDISQSFGQRIRLPEGVGVSSATSSISILNSNYVTVCAESITELGNLSNPRSVWSGAFFPIKVRASSFMASVDNSGEWIVPQSFDLNNNIYCTLKLDNNKSINRQGRGYYHIARYIFNTQSNLKLTINAPSVVKLKDVGPNETATSHFNIRSIISGGNVNQIYKGKLKWALRKDQSNPSDTTISINHNGTTGNTGNIAVSIENNKDYNFEISHRAIKPGEYKFFMDVVLSID